MKRMFVGALVALVAVLGASTAESAIGTSAKVALHLTAPVSKLICTTASPVSLGIPCSSYNVTGDTLTNYSMYIVVGGADPADTAEALGAGITGVTLGLAYNATKVRLSNWTLCADLQFDNDWPNPGGGNVITWATCPGTQIAPDGMHVVVGAISVYAYSADLIQVTPNYKALGTLKATDCAGAEWTIDTRNAARVGLGTPGCNPCATPLACGPVPTAPATWGRIKSLYKH